MSDDTTAYRIGQAIKRFIEERDLPHQATDLDRMTVADGVVSVTLDMDALDPVEAAIIADGIRGIALATEGIEHLRLESFNVDPDARISPPGVTHIVAIGGAKGGVGRTTVTAALATALAESDYNVGIFDVDVDTCDIVRLLGIENPIRSTPDGRPEPIRIDGIQVVSVDLVAGDRPIVWRGATVHDVLVDLLGRATWDDRDVVLLDLPPGLGDAVYTTVQGVAIDGAILVETDSALSTAGVERAQSLFEANDIPIITRVRNQVDPAGDASVIAIPSDQALRSFDGWPTTWDASTKRSLKRLTDAVQAFLETVDAADEAEETIDLRGLPDRIVETQAVLEFADAPDGPRSLLVDDGRVVVEVLTDIFGHDAVGVVHQDDGSTLVRPLARHT